MQQVSPEIERPAQVHQAPPMTAVECVRPPAGPAQSPP
eukprot:SAG31_NODE_8631_length_1417_cov_1.239757_2_plen_37_part_01